MTSRSTTVLYIQLTKSTIAAMCCLVGFPVCVAAVLQALSVLTAISSPVFPRTLKACQPFSAAAFRWLMLSLVSCPSGKVRVRPVLLSRSLSSSAALHAVLSTYISLWLIFHPLADVFFIQRLHFYESMHSICPHLLDLCPLNTFTSGAWPILQSVCPVW